MPTYLSSHDAMHISDMILQTVRHETDRKVEAEGCERSEAFSEVYTAVWDEVFSLLLLHGLELCRQGQQDEALDSMMQVAGHTAEAMRAWLKENPKSMQASESFKQGNYGHG